MDASGVALVLIGPGSIEQVRHMNTQFIVNILISEY